MMGRPQNIEYIGLILWVLRAVIIVLILWGTIATILNNPYSSREWFDLLVFGIVQGSLYALIAVGYTFVYEMLLLINFAHGEFFMSGVMTATIFIAVPMSNTGFLVRQPCLALLIIAIVAVATSVLIALLTECVAYRPLRKAPRLVSLIAALGASLFWRSFFRGLYGSDVKAFPQVPTLSGTIPFFGTELLKSHFVVIIICSLMFLGLSFFITRTKTGKTIRAVAENMDVAVLMGINIDHTVIITFATGAAIAGVAGVLYALVYGKAHFFMGFVSVIKAFTAAMLGGIGSIPGALIGGLFLGIFESVDPGLLLEGLGIPAPYQLKDAIAFVMLIVILIFRPQGILRQQLSGEKSLLAR
jgi:branched-chain amino acid transport system permease protein